MELAERLNSFGGRGVFEWLLLTAVWVLVKDGVERQWSFCLTTGVYHIWYRYGNN